MRTMPTNQVAAALAAILEQVTASGLVSRPKPGCDGHWKAFGIGAGHGPAKDRACAISGPMSGGAKRGRRALWLTVAGAGLVLAGCGEGGENAPPPAVVIPPEAPGPTPPPPPPPGGTSYVGAVYAGTNNFGETGNYVVGFGQKADGTLEPLAAYPTGGTGRGVARTATGPIRLNPLVSEDSMLAVDDRYLLVVNAGSNTISSMRINADFSLTVVDQEDTAGASPVSIAQRQGVVYVANADADGTFTGPPDQSGNVAGFRIDMATGALTPIAGSVRDLGVRPANLEFSPDGRHLLVSGINAGSALLTGRSTAEITSFAVQSDGNLSVAAHVATASTLPGNAGGRNLPNAIGIETFEQSGRQFVVAAESRTVPATGMPGTFAHLQTGSISIWEIAADGSLEPRDQDFLLRPGTTSGPVQPGWIALDPRTKVFWVASSTGAAISGFGLGADGTIARSERVASGIAANLNAPSPLADADGFVDMALSADGRFLYQLVGLKGRVDVYEVDTLVAYNIALRQSASTGLLPMDNLQGLAVVAKR